MVDEKAKKVDSRARNWSLVVYHESAPENWRDILDDYHIPWVESPLHDKDINPDGEIKKAHWHIGLFFSGKKSYGQILEITSKLNCPNPQVMKNAKGQIRYFAHLDNPEKYQYKPSDIIAHGGADIRKYLTATGGDKIKLLAEMQDWIDETGCTEFHELARYARNERFDDWYDIIVNQSTVFLNAYIRSKRHGNFEKVQKENKRN